MKNNLTLLLESLFENNIRAYRGLIRDKLYNFPPAKEGSLGPGYYFTTNPERAKKYSHFNTGVLTVDISLSNPLVGVSKAKLAEKIGLLYDLDDAFEIGLKINDFARNNGHDGIIVDEKAGTKEILVFDKKDFSVAE